jgi:MerR family copper efflux transcriptional regulator
LYEESTLHDLNLIEHYKKLNMPLSEIKSTLEMVKENNGENFYKVEKHFEQISTIMLHLNEEMKEIKPILDNLSANQKEALLTKMSPQGVTLAHSILLLLG